MGSTLSVFYFYYGYPATYWDLIVGWIEIQQHFRVIGPVPQHLIGVEVIEAIGDAMDLQRLSFDLLRRGFGVEAARVKLSVTNPSP